MGLNGEHNRPFLLPNPAPLTRFAQRTRDHVELVLSRTISPIPVGSLVTYYHHHRLRGGIDEAGEGLVMRAKYRRREKAWRFYLNNGLSLTGKQIVGVTVLKSPVEDDQDGSPELPDTLRPCFTCRGPRFWRSIHAVICTDCHPPARPDLVAAWLDCSDKKGGDADVTVMNGGR
jgi:hypothetical protein